MYFIIICITVFLCKFILYSSASVHWGHHAYTRTILQIHMHTHSHNLCTVFFFSKPKRTHFPLCSHSLINRFIVKASLLDTICLLSDHPRLQHEEKMISNIILAQRYHCVSRTHLRHFTLTPYLQELVSVFSKLHS